MGVLEGLKTGKSTLVDPVVGALVGDLVGTLVDPLVGPLVVPLVDPLVGRGSLSPALCVAQIFSEMTRIQARKSKLQAESRSYGPKVGDTAGQPPRIRPESPRKGPRMGFRCFYRNPP